MDRLELHRLAYASEVTAAAGDSNGRVKAAFAATPRERFVGAGPWQMFTPSGYVDTMSDDAAVLYQDVLVALKHEAGINNGQPSLHARCLAALALEPGEQVLHVGAGTGYYTAMLSLLVGPGGSVLALEIEPDLARKAARNLAPYGNVSVKHRSGSRGPLDACDVIYVNAGATQPLDLWLDALRPRGRLLFPLTPNSGFGAMLLVTRVSTRRFDARFICRAAFIPCAGARDDATAQKLSVAFRRGDSENVRSLRRDASPDASCWCAGRGWWLSTAAGD